jgi:hypothetical protein
MNDKPKRRLTAKERNKLLRACDKKCASITAERDKKRAEAEKACPHSSDAMADYACLEKLAKTPMGKAIKKVEDKAINCTQGCAYRSGAWGNSLKNQWSDKLHRLKPSPTPKVAYTLPTFLSMRAATLKNGKRVHSIFTARKHGFYAVYCNGSDAPSRKPDSYLFGEKDNNLEGYWIDRDKVKDVKGARQKDGSILIETKDALDTFCGKNITKY